MAVKLKFYYKGNFDDFDSEMKGYRNDVFVELPNGEKYEVFFYDPERLISDLGNGFYISHPGLIVLKKVNKQAIELAVADLWERGYFNYFKPMNSDTQLHFDETI
jgi:hypothetical protein